MIQLITAKKEEIEIDRREVLRYSCCKNAAPNDRLSAMLERCTDEIKAALSCKACFIKAPVSINAQGVLNLGELSVCSDALKRNLRGCKEAIIFAATIGFQTDRIIKKYSLLSPANAVCAQAAGAAAIEAFCDLICSRFAKAEHPRHLRPRFSPGYGDFPLEVQRDIFKILDCPRKIGVSLNESLLMSPGKSVTAIVGISGEDLHCEKSGCEACGNTDCAYRR